MKNNSLEETILTLMVQHKATLSVAESCSGGRLAARLTSLPGSSEYFLGGMVVYSNEMKMRWLDVPEHLLKDKGAVSSEVAEAMVKGILEKSGSDYAIAITGIAGPAGGTPEKPVGTVWCSIGQKKGEVFSWKINVVGTRHKIMEASVEAVLVKFLMEL
jgi:PncC family amidohydrolase